MLEKAVDRVAHLIRVRAAVKRGSCSALRRRSRLGCRARRGRSVGGGRRAGCRSGRRRLRRRRRGRRCRFSGRPPSPSMHLMPSRSATAASSGARRASGMVLSATARLVARLSSRTQTGSTTGIALVEQPSDLVGAVGQLICDAGGGSLALSPWPLRPPSLHSSRGRTLQ
jgi:hypothetical protein